jgi:diguanylate cyclase (GGDEF)-like protein
VPATATLYWYLFVFTTLAFGLFGFIVGQFEERLARVNEELLRISQTDALTGLYNVRTIAEALPRLISYARRSNSPLSLVMLDVDRFKSVNDRYGHLAGDDFLRRLGKALAEGRRREDVVARIGGEEFIIALPGVDAHGAERVAERVLEAVRGIGFTVNGESVPVTVSAGVAQLEAEDDDRALLARADAAMYAAKQGGRDRVSRSLTLNRELTDGFQWRIPDC